jgi:hypothetical protein
LNSIGIVVVGTNPDQAKPNERNDYLELFKERLKL